MLPHPQDRLAAARVIVLAALVGALAIGSAVPAPPAPWEVPQRLVRLPDGRRLNLYCTGTGKPTVILESGFGATLWSWARVQPLIAATHRVCSYDRAGMGFSDAGPLPRDGAAQVADLAALLGVAKVKPPYILVGHSAGGLSMRLFADAYPRQVAGMVLVDPSVEGQFDGQERLVAITVASYEACARAAAARALPSTDPALARCTPKPNPGLTPRMNAVLAAAALRPALWTTQASEYAAIAGATSAAVKRGRQYYDALPLVVLTAGQTAAASPGWAAAHATLAARSSAGAQRTIAAASHNLMNDAPDAVVDAVAEVSRAPR